MFKKQYETTSENKINLSTLVIIFISIYMVWQMGIVYFSGNSLSLQGRTPIPLNEPLTTLIIAIGYLTTILFHLIFRKQTIITGKIMLLISLIATATLFFPLKESILSFSFYLTAFCCTFLIGTTYSVEASLYSNKCVLRSNIIGTLIGSILIAILQNDFLKLSFSLFNALSILLLIIIYIGYSLLPSKIETKTISLKQASKENKLSKSTLLGLYLSPFISTLLLVFSTTIAESVKHGVFIFYSCSALGTTLWFLLYKKYKISPFKISTISFALSTLGFLLAALSIVFPSITYVSIILISSNILVANLIGFFANTAFEYRPTRIAGSGLVFIGLTIALLQSALLDLFRDNLTTLFAIISIISLISTLLYLLVEPSLSYKFKALGRVNIKTPHDKKSSLLALSSRDNKIVELILSGYTVPEIAHTMNYSEESIKTYKKNIYSFLNIHSKKELYILANKRD